MSLCPPFKFQCPIVQKTIDHNPGKKLTEVFFSLVKTVFKISVKTE